MEIVLRQLAGSSLSDEELKSIIRKVREGGRAGRHWDGHQLVASIAAMDSNLRLCMQSWLAAAVPTFLPGSQLTTSHCLPVQVMKNAAASDRGLTFAEYRAALEGQEISLHVEVPVDD